MGGFIQIGWHAWRWADYAYGGLSYVPTDRYPHPCPHKDCSICYKEKKQMNVIHTDFKQGKNPVLSTLNIQYVKHPEKGAAQMMAILDLLEEHKKPITVGTLLAELAQYSSFETSQTRQRVYKYYHTKMVDNGFIKIIQ